MSDQEQVKGAGLEQKATSYVVLRQSATDVRTWVFVDAIEARSAEAAIRAVAATFGENETQAEHGIALVAVPESSWKPRKASVVIDRKVVLG
jgi:hypothetical protein